MNKNTRTRRGVAPVKPFVSAGVYDPNASFRNPETPAVNQNLITVTTHDETNSNVNNDVEVKSDEIQQQDDGAPTGDAEGAFTGGQPFFRKIFGIRKKPTVRAKERKLRQNRRLRKILLPKNALMALNEVKGIQIGDFLVTSNQGGGFTSVVAVNNIEYEGTGPSKIAAKNACCERALRDLIIQRMMLKPLKPTVVENPTESMDTSENASETAQKEDEQKEDEDDVPILNLASFALYKLFSEWENEGYEIPEFHPHNTAAQSENGTVEKVKKETVLRTDLPPNWETMHPATLLCMMRPGINYIDLGVEGEKPNTTQKIGVNVDDEQYIGSGRSKKLARRDAAVIVCNKLFGTNFN